MELRAKGFTQKKIAEMLGTTRANVSITERRAQANVEKAKRTIEFFEILGATVKVSIGAGTDLFDVPKEVFSKGSSMGIKVREDSISLIEKIRVQAGKKLRGRRLTEKVDITLLKDGRVLVR